MFNTEPGPNICRAVAEPPPRRAAASSRPPPDSHEVQRSTTGRPSPWVNIGPRLAADRTGLYWESKQHAGCVRSVSAGSLANQHRLGAAVNSGYGRVPTVTLHTSAGTTVPTTAVQSPQAKSDGGRGRVQAFAFSPGGFLGRGSFLGSSSSSSAPTSPLDRRTLLYTRSTPSGTASLVAAVGGWGAAPRRQLEQQPQGLLPQRLLPADDLLDRLALLRRLVPATNPTPRPPQLQGGSAAQPSTFVPAIMSAGAHHAAGNGIKRWAWDDSLETAGRPLTAGPAPGWRFCGEVVKPLPAECLPGSSAAFVVNTGGEQPALLVVCSPRQHRLEEEQAGHEEANWPAADRTAGYSRRAAFRPPGPLKHKFGNKPEPRPRSAPGGGERAQVPGLHECGCPKSPRACGVPVAAATRRSASGVGRQHAAADNCRQLPWADVECERGAAAVPPRPRSPGLTVTTAAPLRPALRHRRLDSSTEAEPAFPERATWQRPCSMGGERSRYNGGDLGHRAAGMDVTTVEVTTGDGTTDVVVVSSPRPPSGVGDGEGDVLEVAVTSSPTHGGGSSEVLVVQQRTASPQPQPARPATVSSAPAATQLTVSLPSDRTAKYSFRADASSAKAGRAGGSPIRAWQPPQQARQARQAQQAAATTTVCVDMLASPQLHQPGACPPQTQQQQQWGQHQQSPQQDGQPAAAADHLQQLAGEIRRREQSFNSLLAELEAIQQKCAKLSGPACAKAPAGTQAGGIVTAGASGVAGGSVGLPRPRSSGRKAPASGQAGDGGAAGEKDWRWQSLTTFEAKIREHQRKLVEQGALPPDCL